MHGRASGAAYDGAGRQTDFETRDLGVGHRVSCLSGDWILVLPAGSSGVIQIVYPSMVVLSS